MNIDHYPLSSTLALFTHLSLVRILGGGGRWDRKCFIIFLPISHILYVWSHSLQGEAELEFQFIPGHFSSRKTAPGQFNDRETALTL